MKRIASTFLISSLLVLLASCSQAPTLETPSLTLELGDSTIQIMRGDQDTVAITITRGGGLADPVNLSVSGAPAGVTTTFSADVLNPTTTSSTLELNVAAAATDGAYNVVVQATSGSLAASKTLSLDVASLTVNGVVHGILGDAFANATVAIQGTTAVSGTDGAFSIPGVSLPYDVLVHVSDGGNPLTHVFEGMTSPNPTLSAYGALQASLVNGLYASATIDGNLDSVVPVGSQARVCVEGTTFVVYGCDTVNPGDTAYSISTMWERGTNAPFTLHALVTQLDGDNLPTGYDGYGTATGSVADGGSTTVDVTLGAAPATAPLTINVNAPAGMTNRNFNAGAKLSPTFTMPVVGANALSVSSISVPVPQFAGSTYTVVGQAVPAGTGGASLAWQQMLPSAGTVTFTLDAPPTVVGPLDGASGVGTGDVLEIASTGGSPVTFIMFGSGGSSYLLVTTMSNSITIPDVNDFGAGVGLAPATAYDWAVYRSPTASNMTEAADFWLTDYYHAQQAVVAGGPGSRVDAGTILVTETRSFTTP